MKAPNKKKLEKHVETLHTIKSDIEAVYNEEREIIDSKSEKWQDSDKGQDEIVKVESLESIASDMDELLDNLSTALE